MHEAASRYETGIPEPGSRFADEVERIIALLLERPELESRLDDDLRHFVLRKFLFSVVCAVINDFIYAVALAHGSREPDY